MVELRQEKEIPRIANSIIIFFLLWLVLQEKTLVIDKKLVKDASNYLLDTAIVKLVCNIT